MRSQTIWTSRIWSWYIPYIFLNLRNVHIGELFTRFCDQQGHLENQIARSRTRLTTSCWIFEFGEVQDEVHLVDLNNLEKMVANIGVGTAKNEFSTIRSKVEQVGKHVMNLLVRFRLSGSSRLRISRSQKARSRPGTIAPILSKQLFERLSR